VRRTRDTACIVRVCRDCCCGSERKHPGVDHDGLLHRLEEAVHGGGTVRVSDCLLACDQSNVVVVTPSPAARRAGGRPVWIRHVLDVEVVDAIGDWVRDGGPGWAPPPLRLAPLAFRPSGLSRTYADV